MIFMSLAENSIQRFVHAIEQGGLAKWIRRGLVVAGVITVFLLQVFFQFKGLSTPEGMDHAQLGRQISQGEGFTTKVIRPLALWQLEEHTGEFPKEGVPDTINAPLNPLLNGIVLFLTPAAWQALGQDGAFDDFVYTGDRIIALTSVLLFLGAVIIWYFVARRLFDHRLALIACGLLLVCNLFWEFAKSGLPQMLMLFLFSLAMYALVRAVDNRNQDWPILGWLALTGFIFGLLFLSHGLAFWMFFGALIFAGIYFKPRVVTILVLLGAFILPTAPWLVRNMQVSGNPFGIALYSAYTEVRGTESRIMRSEGELDLTDFGMRGFRSKMQNHGMTQLSNLIAFLGWSAVAPVFFLSLLHAFKGAGASAFRWCVLLMWLCAVVGMAIRGIPSDPVSYSQLHVLFIPLMTFYGLAFLLVTWSRLDFNVHILRIAFIVLLFIICGAPFALGMLSRGPTVHWPPYAPPIISLLNDWTRDDEMVTTDMPWAVAWYADRDALWLPSQVDRMVDMSDYQLIGKPIVAMFLTPETGHKRLLPDVVRGEFQPWFPFILRSPNLDGFLFAAGTPLPPQGEYMIYSDFPRWDQEAVDQMLADEEEEENGATVIPSLQ